MTVYGTIHYIQDCEGEESDGGEFVWEEYPAEDFPSFALELSVGEIEVEVGSV